MSSELMLLLGLAAIFLAIVLLLTTIGTITSERQAVNRSLAAVRAMDTSPDRPRPSSTSRSGTGW